MDVFEVVISILVVAVLASGLLAEANRRAPSAGWRLRDLLIGPFGFRQEDYTQHGWQYVRVLRVIIPVGWLFVVGWFLFGD